MKGITLLSDFFLLIILIIVIIMMSGLLWVIMLIYGVEAQLGFVNPREVTLRVLFNPLKYESVLLTFLELEHQGIRMKKILNSVAIQNSLNVWVDGKPIDASEVSEEFLNQLLEGRTYLLKIVKPEIIIAKSTVLSSSLQKTSTKLFLLNGNFVELEFYVG